MKITIDLSEEEFSLIMSARMKPKSIPEVEPDTTKYYSPVSSNYKPYDVIDNIEVYYSQRLEIYVAWYSEYLDDSVRHEDVDTLVKFIKRKRYQNAR